MFNTDTFKKILNIFPKYADVYFVGGCVRDFILDGGFENIKDFDVEIHNVTVDDVERCLESSGLKYSKVGKSFGVFKTIIDGMDFDISLPRKDSKKSNGHCGFEIEVDPYMGIKEALKRRDFTINAIAMLLFEPENMYGFMDFRYFNYYDNLGLSSAITKL